MSGGLTVLKLGGSVLRSERDLAIAVHEVYRWWRRGDRVVVVVSAFEGTTDRLLAKARAIAAGDPTAEAEAMLLATGELTTASLLVLALGRAGVPATALPPAAAGLRTRGDARDAEPVDVDEVAFARGFRHAPIVVVPGFVGQDAAGQFTLLGRGGSDLTALFLAHRLCATRCRLIKDVDGLYETDPSRLGPRPRRYREIPWEGAAKLGGGVLQPKAVELGHRLGLAFEVAAAHRSGFTRVGREGPTFEPHHPPAAPLRVAMLGLGTVGLGVYRTLEDLAALFDVRSVLVRDETRAIAHGVPASLLTRDPAAAVCDCDVVVELLGGLEPAAAWVSSALADGRSVVSANKALLAAQGPKLRALARSSGAALLGSAAVGGAAPMLERVAGLATTPGIRRLEGVLNGTTNLVLDRCAEGMGFEQAVAEARRGGYAEADSSRDLTGIDAAEKLVLLAHAAWGVDLDVGTLDRRAVTEAAPRALSARGETGSIVRQVAWLERRDGLMRGGVGPRALDPDHALASVRGAQNRLLIQTTDGALHTVDGTGAGRWPSTEAVVADLLDLWRAAVRHKPIRDPLAAAMIGAGDPC